jgi:hypothetical protein
LPILVANEEYPNEPVLHYKDYPEQQPEMFPIGSKEAKEKAPKSTSQIYSTFNRHPELISRVKRVQEGWANMSEEEFKKRHEKYSRSMKEKPAELLRVGVSPEQENLAYSQGGRVVLGTLPFDYSEELAKTVLTSKVDYPVKKQDIAADVIHHELTHEEQGIRDEKMNEKYMEWDRKNMGRGIENPYGKLLEKEANRGRPASKEEREEAERVMEMQNKITQKRYRINPYEANADIVAREYINKRLKKVPEEEVEEGFRNVISNE